MNPSSQPPTVKKKSRIIVKGQIVKALVVSTANALRRAGNFQIKSSSNNVVLLNQYLLPYGTRLFGPVLREVRQKVNFRKVISLARVLI